MTDQNENRHLDTENMPPEHHHLSFFVIVQQLPTALSRLVVKYLLLGFGVALLGITMALYLHTPRPLLLLLLFVWGICKNFSVAYGWANGKIQERAVVCLSSDWNALQKRSNVVFRSTSESDPGYYQYYVPERTRESAFTVGRIYVLYTHVNTPDVLLAWTSLGHFD